MVTPKPHPNVRKTTCPQGHPYAGTNLKYGEKGERLCKTCIYGRTKAWMDNQPKGYRRNRPIWAFAKWLHTKNHIVPAALLKEYCDR